MKWCYRVDLTRRVREPLYGPEAYSTETQRHHFPFGKGELLKTGKEALAAAEHFAACRIDFASSVSIWRLSGGKHGYNGGSGRYLKDSDDVFLTGFK